MDPDFDPGDGAEVGEQAPRAAPTGLTRDEFHAKEKAAFLAGMGQDDPDPDRPPDKAKPKKVIGAPVEDDDEADDEPADAAPEDDEDEAADEDEDEDDEDIAAKPDADPELAKRREAMRQTERRQRASLARDRQAFESERSEWKAQSKAVADAQKRFDDLAARVRYNPTAVLRELGMTEDDFEGAAQHIAAHSKAAGVTPAHKAAAERAMREREAADKASNAEKRVEKLEQTIADERQQAAIARETEAYLGRVVRKVGEDSPLTHRLVAKNPARAKQALAATALELAQKLGQLPKSKAVIAAHEKKLTRELRDLGIAPPAAGAAPAKGAKTAGGKPKSAARPTPAPTPSHVNGMSVLPSRVTIPGRDEIVKELEELS